MGFVYVVFMQKYFVNCQSWKRKLHTHLCQGGEWEGKEVEGGVWELGYSMCIISILIASADCHTHKHTYAHAHTCTQHTHTHAHNIHTHMHTYRAKNSVKHVRVRWNVKIQFRFWQVFDCWGPHRPLWEQACDWWRVWYVRWYLVKSMYSKFYANISPLSQHLPLSSPTSVVGDCL